MIHTALSTEVGLAYLKHRTASIQSDRIKLIG